MFININVACDSCGTRYQLNRYDGGKVAKCYQCDTKFLLPIPCAEQLFEFAKSKTWQRLTKLVKMGLLEGHIGKTRNSFMDIIQDRAIEQFKEQGKERRHEKQEFWREIERTRKERLKRDKQEKLEARNQSRVKRRRTIEQKRLEKQQLRRDIQQRQQEKLQRQLELDRQREQRLERELEREKKKQLRLRRRRELELQRKQERDRERLRKQKVEKRRREFIASASECDYQELNQIIVSGVLSRFCQKTRDEFHELHHQRREQAIANEHFADFGRPMLSPIQERRAVVHRKVARHQRLVRVIKELSPGEFEQYIADLYQAEGYDAKVSGGPNDKGIDVWIYEKGSRNLWAIAQCKRYELDNKVGVGDVLKFVGSFAYTGKRFEKNPVRGFIFATSSFTRQAQDMASNFAWLKLYSGYQIMKHAELLTNAVEAAAVK